MNNQKKAQSLSFNTIIIAVLGLTVLVVLFFVFGGNIGKASENIGSCKAKGGSCAPNNGECPSNLPLKILVSDSECEDVGGACCLPLGNSNNNPTSINPAGQDN